MAAAGGAVVVVVVAVRVAAVTAATAVVVTHGLLCLCRSEQSIRGCRWLWLMIDYDVGYIFCEVACMLLIY